jgi:hypothetical protein
MERFEEVMEEGRIVEKDWTLEQPVCAVCRGVPGAVPFRRTRDILDGFPWKRGDDGKTKVKR